jgi:pyridinium-3,5-biscarboxylic acid mononucleotide synthase
MTESSVVDLEFAKIDIGRLDRRGFPEAVFGAGKTGREIAKIFTVLAERNGIALATRTTPEQFAIVQQHHPDAIYYNPSRCIVVKRKPMPKLVGTVGVVSAGSTDFPVAEEALVTLELFGNPTLLIQDVGVAGLERTVSAADRLKGCRVVIVVAGMEGALPSVLGGLLSQPIIAVPTSVGYGASFGGIAALLGMLNSCSAGVTTVNIDNGFGAAFAASLINRAAEKSSRVDNGGNGLS